MKRWVSGLRGRSGSQEAAADGAAAPDATPDADLRGSPGVGALFKKLVQIGKDAMPPGRARGGQADGQPGSAMEAVRDPKALEDGMGELLRNVDAYVRLEAEGALGELECLEQMNRIAASKYTELASTAEGLVEFREELHARYASIQPALAEVDALHAAVLELDRAADQLEAYSLTLERKADALLA